MNLVVPWVWAEAMGSIQPFAPSGAGAIGERPTFAVKSMLRFHFRSPWFGLSDPAMVVALQDTWLCCNFARI